MRFFSSIALVLGLWTAACGGEKPAGPAGASWGWAAHAERAALLGVHGTSAEDVWLTGVDDGQGPVVLHFDGRDWERKDPGVRGDLWWVNATPGGPVFFGGSNALLLRYEGGTFSRVDTPGLAKYTVYGVWAAAPDDVYLVGSVTGRNGFLWHYAGDEFEDVPLPDGLPEDAHHDTPGLYKVWGNSNDDVWVVGASGVVLHGSAAAGFTLVQSGGTDTLFTVSTHGDTVALVGGGSAGRIYESSDGTLVDCTPPGAPLLQGVSVSADDTIWAVGYGGSVYHGRGQHFEPIDVGLDFGASQSLHAVWSDPSGGVWAVGGNVLTSDLDQGVALHFGGRVPDHVVAPVVAPAATCPDAQIDPAPNGSIARRWNEQLLGAIRRDTPRPTVHARNLFHVSVALWDAWAAYDDTAAGYVTRERETADDVAVARTEALSYAAYRVLAYRYGKATGGDVSLACFDAFMQKLGYDPIDTHADGDDPRALGNRVGQAVIDAFAADGANEANNYADPDVFEPETPNLVVDNPGTDATDPMVWQRLVVAQPETQNGIRLTAGAQAYVGAHWGGVTPFALVRTDPALPYAHDRTPPAGLDDTLLNAVVDVIRRSSELDSTDETSIDISPGALGNNTLGTNDGHGRSKNPVTGKPYAAEPVKRGDFERVLAEFWADGPKSETPPGHWNVVANDVADAGVQRKLFGHGDELDPLAWDVHVYLALNGAVHDAAIAAWELKRVNVTSRPITLIRYMAAHGQRTDPEGPAYDPEGLPLVPGLIEVITDESSAPGERHARLRRYVGETAVRSWRGEPGDRKNQLGGVDWVRGVEWMPYQRRTFVTPAFPGYISGHSTFSRAAATVLASLTGSDAFPGGLGSYRFEPGALTFEQGPSAPVELEWATYYDAADQAGQSRLIGGIHVSPDDLDGRRTGAEVGAAAVERVRGYFDGTAP
jgi:hypothetical protein